MHIYTLESWKHSHRFTIGDDQGLRKTKQVILLTLTMMIVEIAAGVLFGSMALLADGWHMGTHAAALGITALAYYYARRQADNPKYTFGTGKVGVLGGFTSAVVLAGVALLMAVESFERLLLPRPIRFDEAIIVAVTGLIVNLVSAYILRDRRHAHDLTGDHHHHHDYNLKAAYLHVMADALTSVLAIIALITGKALGWIWMDPIMGVVGAAVIMRWSYGLLRDTGKILLDRDVSMETVATIYSTIETDSDNRVSDLHIWRIGTNQLAAIISIVTHFPKPPDHYKKLLTPFKELAHITIEVNQCESEPCLVL
ncbi:MAG: CDF family Co(II)/Ni(II) efflux transporter DmeF [Planctomycetota bacterium]|jgi:cation diffusion facilitator family transporter